MREGGITGGSAGGPQVARLNKRVEDLQDKLLARTDEVSEARRSMADVIFSGIQYLIPHCVLCRP